jgi:hypothetical protein
MLSQLMRLSKSADGRFATATELQFMKDYLATSELRMTTYEKLRDRSAQIMQEVIDQVRSKHPMIFRKGDQDVTGLAQRDCNSILKAAAAAMLIDDLDRLRDGLLLWHQTIIHAVQTDDISRAIWQTVPEVLNQHLTLDELNVVMPALRLNQTLLR